MIRFYKHIIALSLLVFSVLFCACEDRFDDYRNHVIGEGEAVVEGILEFRPSATVLGRSDGDAIQNIRKLSIVIFNSDGEFNQLLSNVDFNKLDPTNDKPDDYPAGYDEDGNEVDLSSDNTTNTTSKVRCSLKLAYGRYYIYAVANYYGDQLTEEKLKEAENPIKYLKEIECDWNFINVEDNAQMFGYFTNDIAGQNTAYEGTAKPDNGQTTVVEGATEPQVVIDQPNVNLYSWIKRLASKVTIAYDGSGLKNNVFVYIHNVSIRQIPLTCTLGDGNEPTEESQVTSAAFDESVENPQQALYYNGQGDLTGQTKYDWTGNKYENWMVVAKGNGVQGAADHTPNDPALFFYENMQGVHADRPKPQDSDKVGVNIGPNDPDYRDDVPLGTFIEVEGYYVCNIQPVSYGPIRYRFMLGQNEQDNYDAIRNCHYKLTLGFNGYANQPDWHIEYQEQENKIYASEVYIPYTYNTSVPYDVRFTGELLELRAEIIENNWAPYYETGEGEVPTTPLGSTSFTDRTLVFDWNRSVFLNTGAGPNGSGSVANQTYSNDLYNVNNKLSNGSNWNSASNYLYGRHFRNYRQIDEEGNVIQPDTYYYVTPIWAGFLRLRVPYSYEDELTTEIPTVCVYNADQEGTGDHYNSSTVLTDFRNYYLGGKVTDKDEDESSVADANRYNLGRHDFDISGSYGEGTGMVYKRGNGRNAYTIKKLKAKDGTLSTELTMNLWTQPKSMCGNSGFSGNNPYEDFNRKAVIRFSAKFSVPTTTNPDGYIWKYKDVTVLQSKRLVNPKAVWRRHDNPQDFKFTLMERNISDLNDLSQFRPVESQGRWSATIKKISDDAPNFVSIKPWGGSQPDGDGVYGNTGSNVTFLIDFDKEIDQDAAACAIIEIKYHDEKCVHNIFVRQGYNKPLKIDETANFYWSAYNLYNCPTGAQGNQVATYEANLTKSPLAFGSFLKRGNYQQAISVSNITRANLGPKENPGSTQFELLTQPMSNATWANIAGSTGNAWHWATFTSKTGTKTRTYQVPTVAQFQTLTNCDFGIGVLYGDGATESAGNTATAYGYLDSNNREYNPNSGDKDNPMFKNGMRGFICYNNSTANQIFFPIGTSGIGRRTVQLVTAAAQRGMLRYGSMTTNLTTTQTNQNNALRPIPFNISNNPGAIYWAYETTDGMAAWDMNYFDLNFNAIGQDVVLNSFSNGSYTPGPNGDALPLRLITLNP